MAFSKASNTLSDDFCRSVNSHISFFLILLLGSSLRLFNLGFASMWRDEIETMVFSLAPLGKIMEYALVLPFIPRPPLYYLITHYFLKISVSSYFLRLPAAICSIISLIILYYLAGRLFDRKVALLSSFLLAISPFQIHYAQEGREYAFLMMMALLSLLLLDLSLELGRSWLIPWIVVCLIILYTHHFGAIIFGTNCFIVLVMFIFGIQPKNQSRKQFLVPFFIAVTLVIILWEPMLLQLIKGVSGPRGMSGFSIKPGFSASDFKTMLGLLTLGNGPWTFFVVILAAIGLLPGVSSYKTRRGVIISLSWIFPTVLLVIFGQFSHRFLVRYIIYIIPIYLIAVSRGALLLDSFISKVIKNTAAGDSKWSLTRTFSIALVIASVLWAFPYLKDYYREERVNWKAASAFLESFTAENDRIIVTGEGEEHTNFQYFILDHYAGLGNKSMVFHLDWADEEDLFKLLDNGHTVWYVATRWQDKRFLFRKDLSIPEKAGYTTLPPIIFSAHSSLSDKEKEFLAPFRYMGIAVIPFWPGLLTEQQIENITNNLLEKARLIPNSHLDIETSMDFLEGKRSFMTLSE